MTGSNPLRFTSNPPARIADSGRGEYKTGDRNWRELFEQDMSRLFFVALIVTGDAAKAESALVASLELLDAEAGGAAYPDLTGAVVSSSAAIARRARGQRGETGETTSPLFPLELQPLLHLDPDLRCCFVLRILARYSIEDCALLLGLPGDQVEELVRTALMSLSCARSAS